MTRDPPVGRTKASPATSAAAAVHSEKLRTLAPAGGGRTSGRPRRGGGARRERVTRHGRSGIGHRDGSWSPATRSTSGNASGSQVRQATRVRRRASAGGYRTSCHPPPDALVHRRPCGPLAASPAGLRPHRAKQWRCPGVALRPQPCRRSSDQGIGWPCSSERSTALHGFRQSSSPQPGV